MAFSIYQSKDHWFRLRPAFARRYGRARQGYGGQGRDVRGGQR